MKLYKDYFKEYIEIYPSMGSYLGDKRYDDKYENFGSASVRQRDTELCQKYVERAIHTLGAMEAPGAAVHDPLIHSFCGV